jgi:hypothetical protein
LAYPGANARETERYAEEAGVLLVGVVGAAGLGAAAFVSVLAGASFLEPPSVAAGAAVPVVSVAEAPSLESALLLGGLGEE